MGVLRLVLILSVVAWFCPRIAAAERVIDAALHHLRIAGEREWTEFPERPEAARLVVKFEARANSAEWTLRLRQQNVKQAWKAALNGKRIGELVRDENDMVVFFAVPPGVLIDGENLLRIEQSGKTPDDIRVGDLRLIDKPRDETLSEATANLQVIDRDRQTLLPCRITVLDRSGSLVTSGASSSDRTLSLGANSLRSAAVS